MKPQTTVVKHICLLVAYVATLLAAYGGYTVWSERNVKLWEMGKKEHHDDADRASSERMHNTEYAVPSRSYPVNLVGADGQPL